MVIMHLKPCLLRVSILFSLLLRPGAETQHVHDGRIGLGRVSPLTQDVRLQDLVNGTLS